MLLRTHVPYLGAIFGGIIFYVLFHLSWFALPEYVDRFNKKEDFLINGSYPFDMWSTKSLKFKFKIYMYNITNAAEIKEGKLANVEEIGPYVFDLIKEHVNVEQRPLTDSISYYVRKTYYFNKNESGNLNENDVFTIFNSELLSSAMELESTFPNLLSSLNEIFTYLFPGMSDIFLRKSVKEIFFDGIEINCENEEVESYCSHRQMEASDITKNFRYAPDNKRNFLFSLLVNGSELGPFEIHRGVNDLLMRGQLKAINHRTIMKIWKNQCDVVNGSEGFFFPPNTKRYNEIEIFLPEICRPLNFIKESHEQTIHKYTINKQSVSNKNSNKKCYCAGEKFKSAAHLTVDCPPSGMIEIKQCLKTNLWLSLPHFYLTNEDFSISNKQSRSDLHSSFINIESVSGIVLNSTIRIQFNQRVKRVEDYQYLANVTDSLVPLGWIEMSYNLPDKFKSHVENRLSYIKTMAVIEWILFSLALTTLIVSVSFCLYDRLKLPEVRENFAKFAQLKWAKQKEQIELSQRQPHL